MSAWGEGRVGEGGSGLDELARYASLSAQLLWCGELAAPAGEA
jgi:hypothetical protein